MKKIFAFDVGISSIGWAYLDKDDPESLDSGVLIFEKAEHPKTGSSLALPRRIARSSRRRNGRRKRRIFKIKKYFSKIMDIKFDEISQDFGELSKFFKENSISPWQLRKDALYRKLNKNEWLKVLLHIAKHRGYNDMIKDSDNDKGKILEALKSNKDLFSQKGYQTIGEMMASEYYNKKVGDNYTNVRNKKTVI